MGIINLTTAKINEELYPVSIHLNQTVSETITGNGSWQSPGTNVNVIPPTAENASYSANSIQYDGAIDVTRYLYSEVVVKAISANTTIILSAGKNGLPDANHQVQVILTSAGDEKLLIIDVPIDFTGNSADYADFFIQANKNFTLVNAQFRLGKRKQGE